MSNVFTLLASLAILPAIGTTSVRAENFPTHFSIAAAALNDTVPPTVVCVAGLSVNLMPTGLITLWAADFLQSAADDVTPPNELQLAVRKAGDGTDFPLNDFGQPNPSVTYDCCGLGTQQVELWVRDAAGNTSHCETYVIVQDPFSNCSFCPLSVKACLRDYCPEPAGIGDVTLALNVVSPIFPPVQMSALTNSGGCGLFSYAVPLGADYTLTPTKNDNPMNGVSTFDLVLMSKHILGIEPLDSPYKMIAADINHSNSVSTFDIVELRKLILGIYPSFPNNTSWRFLDKNFQFADPLLPFESIPFSENISVTNMQADQLGHGFTGIKIGDLNCSAVSNLTAPVEDRSLVSLVLPDCSLAAGETIEVPVSAAEAAGWLGFQFALQADPAALVIEAVSKGDLTDFDAAYFIRPESGAMAVSWFDARPYWVAPDVPLFTLRLRALAPVHLRDVLTLDAIRLSPEAYDGNEQRRPLALTFAEKATVSSVGAITVFAVQPNPTTANAVLPVHMNAAATLRLEVFDLSGRTLFFKEIAGEAGFQTLELPAAVMRQTGVYGWKLVANDQIFTGRLVRQ